MRLYYATAAPIMHEYGTGVFQQYRNFPKHFLLIGFARSLNALLRFIQLCCLAYLKQSINPNGSFKTKLLELFSAYPHTDLKAMGFTKEWQSEVLWKV